MADIGNFIEGLPPIARAISGAALVTSICTHALNLVRPMQLVYYAPNIFNFKRPEVWRLLTPFFVTAPGLGIIMDSFFLFRYASECERSILTRPAKFITFLIFTFSLILLQNHFLFHGFTFVSPLTLALAYLWTAHQPASSRVSFFVATFPAKFLPWVMLLMTMVMQGTQALKVDVSGFLAGHAYVFLTEIWPTVGGGSNLLEGPEAWVEGLINRWQSVTGRSPPPPPPRRGPVEPVRVGGRLGATGSMFSSGWNHRGQGHRLGD